VIAEATMPFAESQSASDTGRRRAWLAALSAGLALAASTAGAQDDADLRASARTDRVLTYGMGYDQGRFSALAQINRATVRRLVPVWNYSLNDNVGEEGQPLVLDGTIYFASVHATVAIDAVSGRQLWKAPIELPADATRVVCCGLVSRGVAVYRGRLYRATLDDRIQALDLKTGKVEWTSTAVDYHDGYAMTGAPLLADGVLITGVAGGEFGIRGFLDGWDPQTGKRLWRTYTIPEPGQPGSETWTTPDSWKHGGGPTWTTGSYDPVLGLVYWGVGNGGPWDANRRAGDNLYTDCVLAIRPKTGEIVWHYQFTPNDPYDYDGVNELVQADLTVGGERRKVIMQADRNGFFYVIDRASGKLLAANPFVKVTWAERVDLATGRPVETAASAAARKAKTPVEVWPSALGGKNWSPMAFSPKTGLAYANTLNQGAQYQLEDDEYQKGLPYFGVNVRAGSVVDGPDGFLKAIDPLSGRAKWVHPWPTAGTAGVLATAGDLVFTGSTTGQFMAFDASTGEVLWQFQAGSGIVGQPITFQKDGRQYVTVPSGIGGAAAYLVSRERLGSVPAGDSLWTFALLPK
jgi:alcohol dehydrogenase (cytochrome c)